MDSKITVSCVVYKNEPGMVRKVLASLSNTGLNLKVDIFDNSSTDNLREICKGYDGVKYTFNNANLGYGKAHNIALRKALADDAKYHLIVNPDIHFEEGTLEKLYRFMEENSDVGLVMPKILYPNGEVQHLCKLLSTPLDLFLRSFLRIKFINKRHDNYYELRFTGYNDIMDVPFLSGCFMFLRVGVLREVGFFDERFFMYSEDIDLSRRIHGCSRTVFYPDAEVFHEFARDSRKRVRLFIEIICSAFKYFNKWGWFSDTERDSINRNTLKKLESQRLRQP